MGLGMGISKSSYDGISKSSYDCPNCGNRQDTFPPSVWQNPPLPNPNPYNFLIEDHWQIGKYLIVKVRYPDCTNYEGVKILMYKDANIDKLKRQGSIDPHFSINFYHLSPIARFVPTDEGLRMATNLARLLTSGISL